MSVGTDRGWPIRRLYVLANPVEETVTVTRR